MPKKNAARGGWLFKQEPDCYSYTELEIDGMTLWDGVANALARQNLRKILPGDRVLYYHTGTERAIVGTMRAESGPMPDPNAPDDAKAVVIKVSAAGRWEHPVTLAMIKADELLSQWDLVRLPRLSVVPVSPEQWRRLEELAAKPG